MKQKKGNRKVEIDDDDDDDIPAKVKKGKARKVSPFPDELYVTTVEGTSPPEFKVITDPSQVDEGTKVAAYKYDYHGVTRHAVSIVDEDEVDADAED
jgi:hypothetical protein